MGKTAKINGGYFSCGRDNFLIDRQHILPLRKSNSYPQHEFILEGRVTYEFLLGYSSTFKANFDGYKVSGFMLLIIH